MHHRHHGHQSVHSGYSRTWMGRQSLGRQHRPGSVNGDALACSSATTKSPRRLSLALVCLPHTQHSACHSPPTSVPSRPQVDAHRSFACTRQCFSSLLDAQSRAHVQSHSRRQNRRCQARLLERAQHGPPVAVEAATAPPRGECTPHSKSWPASWRGRLCQSRCCSSHKSYAPTLCSRGRSHRSRTRSEPR